ncbi:MAG: lysoplasmalogenase [Deltaproteobacteria bacterium]|nr:MAG: lysoplasmalogenase [Deltaproteobacteria bacterium]
MLPWILLTVVALAVVLYGEYSNRSPLVWVAKPLASAGFMGAAVANGAFETGYGNAIFMALAWSLIGDVLLIPRNNRPAFTFGLLAFLVSHIGYLVSFRVLGFDGLWLAIAVAALIGPAYLVFRWLRPNLPPGMVAPVTAYIVVITAMVAGAVATWPTVHAPLVLVAAVLFYLSDLTVARQRFVAPGIVNRLVGLPLYYAAQFVFVLTVTPPG